MGDINIKIIDALEQIPTLVKAAETYKETSNRIIATLSDAIKKRPQAEFTDEELQKLAQVISTTRCASPDMASISRELARRVSDDVAAIIGNDLKAKAAEALKGASVMVEHSHYVERNLKDIVEKKVKKKISILWIVIFILLGVIGITAVFYYNSDLYWGREFYEVYASKYITADEKAALERGAGYTGILPYRYNEDPGAARVQLKRNKEILKKREKEAQKNKGTFRTEEFLKVN